MKAYKVPIDSGFEVVCAESTENGFINHRVILRSTNNGFELTHVDGRTVSHPDTHGICADLRFGLCLANEYARNCYSLALESIA